MQTAAIVIACVSFTIGVFLWSKHGIKRGESHEKFFREDF